MSFYPSEWFAADQSVELNKRMARLERERVELLILLDNVREQLAPYQKAIVDRIKEDK